MNPKNRNLLLFSLLATTILYALYININTGSVNVSIGHLLKVLFDKNYYDPVYSPVIWQIRLPRLLGAMLFGGALAVSGVLIQAFFRNPIAGPFVLGISSGSKMLVGLVVLANFRITSNSTLSGYSTFLAAFLGALLSMLLVLLISRRVRNQSMLLVVGMMIGYICSAVTDFLITFASTNNIKDFVMWSMGSFSGISWNTLTIASTIIIPTLVGVLFITKQLDALLLGESYAKSMGLNIRRFRVVLIFFSSVLAACVTAFAGPISFIGIAVPHIVRTVFKTSSAKIVVPASLLLGGCTGLLCDLVARTAFSPTELALSTVTSLFGAPIVILLMINRKSEGQG